MLPAHLHRPEPSLIAKAKLLLEQCRDREARTSFYEPKDPSKDGFYRRASDAYGDAAGLVAQALDLLERADSLESEAEGEEPELDLAGAHS
jgi:hypothetical protein